MESGNLIFGPVEDDESTNFRRCVGPVVNEKALEPSQVNLFVSLYNHDNLRRNFSSQYVGQWSTLSGIYPFHAFTNALLMLTKEERCYSQSFIAQTKY
jgi:hypothetical protein